MWWSDWVSYCGGDWVVFVVEYRWRFCWGDVSFGGIIFWMLFFDDGFVFLFCWSRLLERFSLGKVLVGLVWFYCYWRDWCRFLLGYYLCGGIKGGIYLVSGMGDWKRLFYCDLFVEVDWYVDWVDRVD